MKGFFAVGAVVLLTLITAQPSFAQGGESALVLHLTRDFGYAGFSNDIEGLFSISVDGPENLARVNFYIDAQLIATIERAPFRYQFSTKSFTPGEHHLYALGTTFEGQELRSNEFVRIFLSAEEARGKVTGLMTPILAIVILIVALGAGMPLLFGGSKAQVGQYGISGGAVCPKCGLPVPLHIFGFHAGFKRLERCPHCGNWAWVQRARLEDLAAAEARWRGEEGMSNLEKTGDRLRRQIDESRYDK